MHALRKSQTILTIAGMLLLSGCVSLGRPETVREVHFTRVKMGTPAYVVNEVGKPQIVRAQIMVEGKLEVGKVDANGMVLLDEPTLDYYRALDAQKGQ